MQRRTLPAAWSLPASAVLVALGVAHAGLRLALGSDEADVNARPALPWDQFTSGQTGVSEDLRSLWLRSHLVLARELSALATQEAMPWMLQQAPRFVSSGHHRAALALGPAGGADLGPVPLLSGQCVPLCRWDVSNTWQLGVTTRECATAVDLPSAFNAGRAIRVSVRPPAGMDLDCLLAPTFQVTRLQPVTQALSLDMLCDDFDSSGALMSPDAASPDAADVPESFINAFDSAERPPAKLRQRDTGVTVDDQGARLRPPYACNPQPALTVCPRQPAVLYLNPSRGKAAASSDQKVSKPCQARTVPMEMGGCAPSQPSMSQPDRLSSVRTALAAAHIGVVPALTR